MIPMGKPMPGREADFKRIFLELINFKEPKVSWLDKFKGKKVDVKAVLYQQWLDLQVSSFESLGAPMVGRDKSADLWAAQKYEESEKKISVEDFRKELDGHYVLDLIDDCDGIAKYISNSYDRNVFRGEFMRDCFALIGEELAGEAWETKFAEDALDYGNRLMATADAIASENRMEYLKVQREFPETFDEESIESQLHIIYSLARWLIFYGQRGHGYEADF